MAPTLAVNRRTRFVLVSCNISYAAMNVGKDIELRVSCCNRPPRLGTNVRAGGLI